MWVRLPGRARTDFYRVGISSRHLPSVARAWGMLTLPLTVKWVAAIENPNRELPSGIDDEVFVAGVMNRYTRSQPTDTRKSSRRICQKANCRGTNGNCSVLEARV